VDVVLDAVGGRILRQSLDLLPPFGRAVVYGMASGETVDIPASLFFGARSVTGFSLYATRQVRPDQARRDMTEVTGYVEAGQLHTPVHARIPLADAAEAHRLLEERSPLGRVLLVP
jgi:NADPH:quinone reductase